MKCSFCDKKSVYFRRNEGNYYCKDCFVKSVEKRVRRTLGSHKLVKNGDKIAVAISGGKDSSNLLFLLNKIFGKNPKIKILAITLDEGIREYRDKSLKETREFCENLGIDHRLFSFKDEFGFTVDSLSKKMRSGFCGTCGMMRRYLLNKKAKKLRATKLATGHNLDDECQTILMNALKGDLLRLSRIGSMPMILTHPKFVTRIKPLITIPERESALFTLLNDIPAGFDECPYRKDNALRQRTREYLNRLEETSPGLKWSLFESVQRIAPLLEKKFKLGRIRTCESCGEPSSQRVCRMCEVLSEVRK